MMEGRWMRGNEMDAKIKHMEMIQGVINRMASNSFSLKGWSVVLVSALFALAASQAQFFFVLLAYFPAFAFWILDAYYLRQERLFRKLYDDVRTKSDGEIDFSMDTTGVASQVSSWFRTALSTTVLIFHGAVFGSILVVMAIIRFVS